MKAQIGEALHPLGDQNHNSQFNPGVVTDVPTRSGLLRADVHGGAIYRGFPVSWKIGPYHRVPFVAEGGDGSQAMPITHLSQQQREEANQMGLFAFHDTGAANFDAGPMPGDQALGPERYLAGDFVPGNPLAVMGQLGIYHTAPALLPSRIGTGGRSGW